MPNTVKYLWLTLIVLLLGMVVYLGYLYSLKVKTEKQLAQQPKETTLTGQVLAGSNINLPSPCDDRYYLVSGQTYTLLALSPDEVDIRLPKYKYAQVEVAGIESEVPETVASCTEDGYLTVSDISLISEGKLSAREYEGEVFCLAEGEDEDGPWCAYGLRLNDGADYALRPFFRAVDFGPLKGVKVKVLGVLDNEVIDIFEIEKI